ncbi:Uncharacterised protein [Mycobacteroides abscessus subsp. abscessus]|nr:Uncharacterised protein [Mycobacteroides abscessus subsp. abscessus]
MCDLHTGIDDRHRVFGMPEHRCQALHHQRLAGTGGQVAYRQVGRRERRTQQCGVVVTHLLYRGGIE